MLLHRIPANKSRRHDRRKQSPFSNPYCSNGFREGWPDDPWKRTCGANKIVTWLQWLLCRLFTSYHSERPLTMERSREHHGNEAIKLQDHLTLDGMQARACCLSNVGVPPHPPLTDWNLNPSVRAWGVRAREVIRWRGQSPHEESDVRALTSITQGHGEETVTCGPGRVPHQAHNLLVPWSWTSQPPEFQELKCCFISHPFYSILLQQPEQIKLCRTLQKCLTWI